jgi:hypothetical protein
MDTQTAIKPELKQYSIDLDCPPGWPRPDELLPDILEGTRLSPQDFTNVMRLFGNWRWHLNSAPELVVKYEKARPTIKARIEALHNTGTIRYGSW